MSECQQELLESAASFPHVKSLLFMIINKINEVKFLGEYSILQRIERRFVFKKVKREQIEIDGNTQEMLRLLFIMGHPIFLLLLIYHSTLYRNKEKISVVISSQEEDYDGYICKLP